MVYLKTLRADKPDSVSSAEAFGEGWCDYHLSVPKLTKRDQSAHPVPCPPFGGSRTSRPQAILYVAFQHARFTRMYDHSYKLWALTSHFHPCLPKL